MTKTPAGFADLVKRHAILAMFSDDQLMVHLVLKGGNLLDIVYGISTRSSVDLDFSVEGDLGEIEPLRLRIEATLKTTFAAIGYEVFDVNACEVPPNLTAEMAGFWGGYKVDFKLIEHELFTKFGNDIEQIRRNAASVGSRGSSLFKIDISKHEFCGPKQAFSFHNLTIYGYTPVMVICEKLRAICQQMPEYAQVVGKHRPARARDFVDIHTICMCAFRQTHCRHGTRHKSGVPRSRANSELR